MSISEDLYKESMPRQSSVPVARVMGKLDEFLDADDFDSADRLLKYWLAEAEAVGDARGKLALLNEQIGLYRKSGRREECLSAAASALKLCESEGLTDTVVHGTTLVNAATGCKAFDDAESAAAYYEKAMLIYERLLPDNDERLGTLYNNMGITLNRLGDFRRAEQLFHKALDIMAQQKNAGPEMAITWLNLADLAAAERGTIDGEAEIDSCLDKAEELLEGDETVQNGHYAFVCEKCAPSFEYYGRFLTSRRLMKRAEEIRERA